MNITEISKLKSNEDLSRFITELHLDYLDNPDGWENGDLSSFLQAMAAFIKDIDGYYRNLGKPMPDVEVWKTLAEIVYASKIYE